MEVGGLMKSWDVAGRLFLKKKKKSVGKNSKNKVHLKTDGPCLAVKTHSSSVSAHRKITSSIAQRLWRRKYRHQEVNNLCRRRFDNSG